MEDESDIWLIRSKMHPSGADVPLLHRARLTEKTLSDGLARVVLVSAPPGFGKTSFLSSLFHQVKSQSVNAAWLSLDEFDRKSETFAAYLITALSEAGVDLGHLPRLAAEGFLGNNMDAAWQTLVSRMELEDRRIVLFLDDYHLAATPDIDKRLRYFITHMPADCHIVIGSREHPNVGVPRLFSQSRLQLIGPQSLKFDVEELDAFFEASLDAPLLNAVMERTEGWPVAVNLAKIWMENRREPSDLSNFSGHISDIANYLTEEVFSGLSDDHQLFMMQTAFLERINGDLANAVCNRSDSWETLEELEKRNLFIVPIGQTRKWRRYHQLIREFLQDRYRRLYPDAIADLHRRAAEWFCDHLFIDEALRHAQKTADPFYAFALMENAGGWQLGLTHGVPALRSICTLQNPDIIQFPRVELAHIYLAQKESRIDDAAAQLERLEKATSGFQAFSPSVSDATDIQYDALIIKSFIDFYRDKELTRARLQDQFSPILEAPDLNPKLKVLANNMISISIALEGDYDQAIDSGLRALSVNRALDLHYGGMYLSIYIGLSYLQVAEPCKALDFYNEISRNALNSLGVDNNIYTNCQIFCAEANYLMNDLSAAEKLISMSFDNAVHGEIYYNVLWSAYSTAAYIARHNQDKERALSLLRELQRLAAERRLERLAQIARFREIDEFIYWDDLNEARRAIEASCILDFANAPVAAPNRSVHPRLAAQKTYARYLLATKDYSAAYDIAKAAGTAAELMGQRLQLTCLRLIASVAAAHLGNRSEAASTLASAIDFALPRRLLRPFTDELAAHHDTIAPIIASLDDVSQDDRQTVVKLFQPDAFKAHSLSRALTILNKQGAPQTVTAREMDVLTAIADGLSNKEIASQLGLSEATIKFHRRNLYQKFTVNSRSRLIEAAKAQGVISAYRTDTGH